MIINRLTQQGIIRHLDRGVYDFPKQHDQLGKLSPDPDRLARAVAPKAATKVFVSGAMAANALGLSTQVPAKPTYTTNAPTHYKRVAGQILVFKRAKIPLLDKVSDKANLTLQALAHLGKNNIDSSVLRRCADTLTDRDVQYLATHADRTPGWMAGVILKIKRAKDGHFRNKD